MKATRETFAWRNFNEVFITENRLKALWWFFSYFAESRWHVLIVLRQTLDSLFVRSQFWTDQCLSYWKTKAQYFRVALTPRYILENKKIVWCHGKEISQEIILGQKKITHVFGNAGDQ